MNFSPFLISLVSIVLACNGRVRRIQGQKRAKPAGRRLEQARSARGQRTVLEALPKPTNKQ
jgi:hypothetical protein